MYRQYVRGDNNWFNGLRFANDFIDGALARHIRTWTRYGHLGVQDNINCDELRARLPVLIDKLGSFGLLIEESTAVRLLVPWPGNETWTLRIGPRLSSGVSLSRTFWNRMPRLGDASAADPLDDTAMAAIAAAHSLRHLDSA